MPMITIRQALTASSTATPLQGTAFELPPFDCYVEIGMLADATGVLATVQTGSDVIQEESPVQIGTINVQPTYPDHFLINDTVPRGERIKIQLRDTSGAARVVMVSVKLTEIG